MLSLAALHIGAELMQDLLRIYHRITPRLYVNFDRSVQNPLLTSRLLHTFTPSPLPDVAVTKRSVRSVRSGKRKPRLQSALEKRARNIVVDDLAATLEAHRAYNRASNLSDHVSDQGSKGHETHPGRKSQKDNAITHRPAPRIGVAVVRWKDALSRRPADPVPGAQGLAGESEIITSSIGPEFVKADDPLEYEGMPRDPQNTWRLKFSEREGLARPWVAYMNETGEAPSERLSSEILAFEAYMKLTPAEEVASRLVFTDVRELLEKQCRIKLLGSRSTGLATSQSDIDISASYKSHKDYDLEKKPSGGDLLRKTSLNLLRHVQKRISQSKLFDLTLFVRARIPIVCAKHIATGLEVQIQGPVEFSLQQEFIETYLAEIPQLRPVYIAIRHCLTIRDLATSSRGGLGSYSILMMIIRALKCSEVDLVHLTLADQLLHVLKFWGSCDTYNFGYSVDPPMTFQKTVVQHDGALENTSVVDADDPQSLGLASIQIFQPRRPYLLCLQDPTNHLNDLGKNANDIKHIQRTFLALHDCMRHTMEVKQPLAKDFLGPHSHLAALVQANYLDFEHHRSRVEQYALPQAEKNSDFSEERLIADQADRAQEFKKRAGHANEYRKRRQQEALIQQYQMPSASIYGSEDARFG